ncbi:hypothetical protein RIR_jg4087.t1 [Rhizophagus irregularis DAOM 181602=DAOM 197198]|nr:hypothetical protein RIR_jg4087.t1 [Rhizophagus irregularis DAOM 181602=DAOM 197198]
MTKGKDTSLSGESSPRLGQHTSKKQKKSRKKNTNPWYPSLHLLCGTAFRQHIGNEFSWKFVFVGRNHPADCLKLMETRRYLRLGHVGMYNKCLNVGTLPMQLWLLTRAMETVHLRPSKMTPNLVFKEQTRDVI